MNALTFYCPLMRQEFTSGVYVESHALARIERIAVRMKCPICEEMHLLIERGLLEGEDELS